MSTTRALPRVHAHRWAPLCAAALALPACADVLGIDDVALDQPGTGASTCTAVAHLGVLPTTTPMVLSHHTDGALVVPQLLVLLNGDAKPDALVLRLYDNMGQHGVFAPAAADYPVTTGDSRLETCGLCVFVETDYDSGASQFAQTYWASSQGSLHLTRNDTVGVAGSLRNLRLRTVDTSGGTTRDLPDHCTLTIDGLDFDARY